MRRINMPLAISGETRELRIVHAGIIFQYVTADTNVIIARRRSKDAGVDIDLRYLIPKEGAVSWFDVLSIPLDAPHLAEAYEFLDYLLRPEIAARNANFTGS